MSEQNNSLKAAEAAVATVSVAPRVSLADIEASIADKFYLSGANAAEASLAVNGVVCQLSRDQHVEKFPSLSCLTICVVVMKNGFTIIGKSAPASPENFNDKIGRDLAYEDAVRQLLPLKGFALKDRLYQQATTPQTPGLYPPNPE